MKTNFFLILLFTTASLLFTGSLRAEGSRELNNSTRTDAFRIFLSYTNPVTGTTSTPGWYRITSLDSIEARNYFYVYARVGDSICVASSALGVGTSGAIQIYGPGGALLQTYTAPQTIGGIPNHGLMPSGAGSKAIENQGPFGLYNGGTGGYRPLTIVAATAGVYRITFISPDPASSASNYFNNPTLVPRANADFNQTTNNTLISAFDVSIIKNGVIVPGRMFTDYMSLSGGDLRRTNGGISYYFTEYFTLRVLTREGYRYNVSYNGVAPYGYFIYADNVGMQLNDGINPAYESIIYQPTRPANRRIFKPGDPETDYETKHKIFFNEPDNTMPATATSGGATTWLYSTWSATTYNTTVTYLLTQIPNPLSGYFQFGFTVPGVRFKIYLDLNKDNIYGNAQDYILSGITDTPATYLYWDGLDSSGNPVTLGALDCYNMKIEFLSGEMHIPLTDAENFRNGLEIARLNGNNTSVRPDSTVHWNDLPLNDNTNLSGSFVKRTPAAGVWSNGGVHRWERTEPASPPTFGYTGSPTHPSTVYYGDNRYMDTWAYDTLNSKIYTGFLCYSILGDMIGSVGIQNNGSRYLLNWKQLQDGAGGFTVDYSYNGTQFYTAKTLNAQNRNYVFGYDVTALAQGQPRIFFRIVYTNGAKKEISPIKSIKQEGITRLQVLQNTGSIQLITQNMSAPLSIRISDAGGRIITRQQAHFNSSTVSTSQFQPGVYWITVQDVTGRQVSNSFIIL
jgi:hypothetical protein